MELKFDEVRWFDEFLVLNENKAGYTVTKVACGWAGAVIIKADLSVWAGAVM